MRIGASVRYPFVRPLVSWPDPSSIDRKESDPTRCRLIYDKKKTPCPKPKNDPPAPTWAGRLIQGSIASALSDIFPLETKISPFQKANDVTRPLRLFGAFVVGNSDDATTSDATDKLNTAWVGMSTLTVTSLKLSSAAPTANVFAFPTSVGEGLVLDGFRFAASSADAWDFLRFSVVTGGTAIIPPSGADALEGEALGVQIQPSSQASLIVSSFDTLSAFCIVVSLDGWYYPVLRQPPNQALCEQCGRDHA